MSSPNEGARVSVEAEKEELKGWLYKKGDKRKTSYKKRYFKCKDGKIFYYSSATSDKEVGIIDLTEVTGVQIKTGPSATASVKLDAATGATTANGSPAQFKPFEVITKKQTIELGAKTDEERDFWIKGLKELLKSVSTSPAPVVSETGSPSSASNSPDANLLKKNSTKSVGNMKFVKKKDKRKIQNKNKETGENDSENSSPAVETNQNNNNNTPNEEGAGREKRGSIALYAQMRQGVEKILEQEENKKKGINFPASMREGGEDDSKTKIKELNDELQGWKTRATEAESKLHALMDDLAKPNEQVEGLKKEKQEAESKKEEEVQKLREELNKANQERQQQQDNSAKQLKEKEESFEQRLKDLQAQLTDSDTKHRQLQEQHTKNLSDLKQREDQYKTLETTVNDLNLHKSNSDSTLKTNQELLLKAQTELKTSQDEHKKLSSQLESELQTTKTSFSKSEEQRKLLQKELLEAKNKTLEDKSKVEKFLEEKSRFDLEIKKLNETLKGKEEEARRLEGDVAKRQEETKRLEGELKKKDEEVKKVEEEGKKRGEETKRLEEELKKKDEENKRLEGDGKSKEEQFKRTEEMYKKREESLGTIKNQMQNLKEKLKKSEEDAAKQSGELAQLRKQEEENVIKQQQEKINKLSLEVAGYESEQRQRETEYNEKVNFLLSQIDEITAQTEEYIKLNSEQATELEELRRSKPASGEGGDSSDVAELEETIRDAAERIKSLEDELEGHKSGSSFGESDREIELNKKKSDLETWARVLLQRNEELTAKEDDFNKKHATMEKRKTKMNERRDKLKETKARITSEEKEQNIAHIRRTDKLRIREKELEVKEQELTEKSKRDEEEMGRLRELLTEAEGMIVGMYGKGGEEGAAATGESVSS
eukprot:TRINITY_DN4061_c0_g1_i1.p1 TRINITY_DN4061_c0_g1~~TRINITY_DN4061_c0_g1_i1.p1  ORF type:complete len:892 (-),score=348.97 TRINITY_DN4061_c0_g1_i1:26-2680(-)